MYLYDLYDGCTIYLYKIHHVDILENGNVSRLVNGSKKILNVKIIN